MLEPIAAGVYTFFMIVSMSLIILFVFDAALIYLIYFYNRRGTINIFLALLLIPITLANLEMFFLYSASHMFFFKFGLNLAVFDTNFFFPLIFHFTYYFPRKQRFRKQIPALCLLYLPPVLFGIGMFFSADPTAAVITFRDFIHPAAWLLANPLYYGFFLMNFIFVCVLLGLTTRRFVNSLKLQLLAREKKTVIMMLLGFIPLSFILIFNYLIFVPFKGGIYFYLFTSIVYTVFFMVLVFRFGFLDRAAINRVFIHIPITFALLVFLYSTALPPVHAFLKEVFGLEFPVVVSLEILFFIAILSPVFRILNRFLGKNRSGKWDFFFHTLKEAAAELVRIIDLSELDRFFMEVFVYRIRLRTFFFLPLDEASDSFRPVKIRHQEEFPSFPADGELVDKLRNEKQTANTQQIALSWSRGKELEILDHFKIVLIVPLLDGNTLVGILMFGEPGIARTWRQEEIEEIEMFALGTPVVIARCRTHAQAIAIEQKQARIERMAVLHELTSGIAHELRNPLSIISNSAETLANRNLPEMEIKKLAGYIGEETERMAKLLSKTLAFVPRNEYHHGITNIVPVLERTFDLVGGKASGQETRLEIRCEKKRYDAIIDREALTQVCLNLSLNALEAVERGGYVRVEVREDGDFLVIEFINNGKPIPEEICAKLFDPFFTTKENGTGLGLSISSRLVEQAGGHIRFQNGSGEVVFQIYLPLPGKVMLYGE